MTTSKLREYLQVLQDMNVMSFSIKALECGDDLTSCSPFEFSVVMGPTIPTDGVGVTPEPGGWKTPDNLDNPDKLFNYDKEPSV